MKDKTITINKWKFDIVDLPIGTFILFVFIWFGGFLYLHFNTNLAFYWLLFVSLGYIISTVRIEKEEYEIKVRLRK